MMYRQGWLDALTHLEIETRKQSNSIKKQYEELLDVSDIQKMADTEKL
jgi:RNA polymerase-interacting CarD/CdnL/TRCF family regulator